MSIPVPPAPAAGTLDLLLPDWSALDTVRRHPLPFALWNVGDQCLLYHWLDYAVNGGFESVRIHVVDRPAQVRQAIEAATLWPIPQQVVSLRDEADAPAGAQKVTSLPEVSEELPTDGWSLLELLARLEKRWLEDLAADPAGDLLRIGAACRIHPDARLFPPYFIGDNVFIGPGCEIGPHATVGAGSMLAGANLIARSQVSPHTFLGPMTALEDCLLDGGVLFNRRNRARLDRLESHISSPLAPDLRQAPPSWTERLLARRLLWKLGTPIPTAERFFTHDGRELPGGDVHDLKTRLRWLQQVARGRLRLFGVLPRTREQLEALPADWRNVLRDATIGVFSYADCHGSHSPEDPDEALHAVYQTTLDDETLRPILRSFLGTLSPSGFQA